MTESTLPGTPNTKELPVDSSEESNAVTRLVFLGGRKRDAVTGNDEK